jgi:hypothetical protein
MLDAVYVDAKQTKSIAAIRPKPPFKPVFQVAASREGSDIRIINEPLEGSSVFLVETGEGRTYIFNILYRTISRMCVVRRSRKIRTPVYDPPTSENQVSDKEWLYRVP